MNEFEFGKQCFLPISELHIDHSYQRPEVSKGNTNSIAKEFNWKAFGTLVAMKRGDGEYYVVDGQQRLMAIRKRGDILAVPCIVFESEGSEQEARAFIALNVNRRYVSAVAKFRAAVNANLQPETEIAAWLATQGLRVAADDGKDVISFAHRLLSSWKKNSGIAKRAILLQREIVSPEPLHHSIHIGLCWLLRKYAMTEKDINKLKTLGGRVAILRSIKATEIETGLKANRRVSGIGILNLINYKKRKKVVFWDD